MSEETKIDHKLGEVRTLPAETELERHPLSAIFSSVPVQPKVLDNSLQVNGQLREAVLYQGKVLIGWDISQGLSRLGMELRVVDYLGNDPVRYVANHYFCQESTTGGQRLLSAARLANLKPGKRANQDGKETNSSITLKEAATMSGFSMTTLKIAKKILDSKHAGIIAAVESGKISVDLARKLIDQDNAKIEKVLNSDTPKKTADKLFPSSNEEESDSEDDGSAPEVGGANRQGGPALKKDKAEALFVRAQQGYEKLPDAQKKRFRDLIRKFLAEEVAETPEPGVQDASEEVQESAAIVAAQ